MGQHLRELWRDESGTATVEYALLLSAIVVGTASAWHALSAEIGDVVNSAVDTLGNAGLPGQ